MLRKPSLLILLSLLLVCLACLQGCGNSSNDEDAAVQEAQALPSASPSSSTAAETKAESPSPSPSPAPAEDVVQYDTATFRNDTGKTLIKSAAASWGKHISFAIISKQGTVIVADPNAMPELNGVLKADVITTTFMNHDHTDPIFTTKNKDAKVSESKVESFELKDVKVTGIAASHIGDPVDPNAPTNVIYVYEVDGLRLAYFAGVDQSELTKEQLNQLGAIDIAFIAFNDAPVWHVKKEVSIKILEQVKPTIVIPLESKPDIADEIMKAAKITDSSESDFLAVDRSDLDKIKATTVVNLKALDLVAAAPQ